VQAGASSVASLLSFLEQSVYGSTYSAARAIYLRSFRLSQKISFSRVNSYASGAQRPQRHASLDDHSRTLPLSVFDFLTNVTGSGTSIEMNTAT
jgi:hypothetical protein